MLMLMLMLMLMAAALGCRPRRDVCLRHVARFF